jgi:hypothetical protein
MELKPQDIIHITSDSLNGFFLIEEITYERIRLKQPPREEYTLEIIDGVIPDVEITLVHSAIYPGYAQSRGFLPEKKVRIEMDETYYGVIQSLEKDMIEVLLSEGDTIFIDFEYKGPPDIIQSIVLDSGFDIEYEEIDIYASEGQSRFTLDRQVNDLMDHLLSGATTSSKTQEAIQTVQRFTELRALYSNAALEPIYQRKRHAKGVIPVVNLRRKLYTEEIDTVGYIQDLRYTQTKKESFSSIYKKLLSDPPFELEKVGEEVTTTKQTMIRKDKICKVHKKDSTVKRVSWIPQVVVEPYQLLQTTPEIIQPVGYLLYPSWYYQSESNSLPLLRKIPYHAILPYVTMKEQPVYPKPLYPQIMDCLPSFPLYSIYYYLMYLGCYDFYKQDIRHLNYNVLTKRIQENINDYSKPSYPSYKESKVVSVPIDPIHIAQESLLIQLDEKQSVQKLDETKSVAPPVVKVYDTLRELEKDNKKIIFHDKELDRTNYDEMDAYTTLEEMIRFLIKVKRMLPSEAGHQAPHFLNRQRRVVQGEYAKVGYQYYKRISEVWKLDETCSGPYPCTTTEPMDSVDLPFRLKENALYSMMQEVKIDHYSKKAERDLYLRTFLEKEERIQERRKRMTTLEQRTYPTKAIIHITESPYMPLFQVLLQKPDRFAQIKEFIKQNTRLATKDEDTNWYYCLESNVKLVPVVFDELIKAYEKETFMDTLQRLKLEGSLQTQEERVVTTHGGFLVGALDTASNFEDLVRSTVDDFFLELPREVHPNTPLVVDILNETVAILKVNITAYFNYIIHEAVTEHNLLVTTVAMAVKIAQVVHKINIEDFIAPLLKKQQKFDRMLDKYGLTEQITAGSLQREIISVSSKYGIQTIQQKKPRIQTIATPWTTFLPSDTSKIVHELEQRVKRTKPMVEGKISTWHGELRTPLTATLEPSVRVLNYTRTLLFTIPKEGIKYEQPPSKIIPQEKPPVVRPPVQEEYETKIPPLKQAIRRYVGDFIPPEIPLYYLRTFIQNISKTYPSYLSHRIEFDDIPHSMNYLAFDHKQKLFSLMHKQIFAALRKFTIDVSFIVKDEEIKALVENLTGGRAEYEYTIYFILKKYLDHENRQIVELLKVYLEFFVKEYKGIFLSYEEIQRLTLKDKVSEANQRRLQQNALDTGTKYVKSLVENANLTKEVQLGRSRDYLGERYEGNDFIYTQAIELPTTDFELALDDIRDDADHGEDGNWENQEDMDD